MDKQQQNNVVAARQKDAEENPMIKIPGIPADE